jgi:predicted GIY-YIG superfamily endonuclease
MNDHDLTHVVYRCYDADDRLLYIGCTRDIGARMQVHYASPDNPASVVIARRMERVTETEYPDKATAQAAEREAIYNEAPMFNLHHQRERVTPAQRDARIAHYLEETRPPVDPETAAWFRNELDKALAAFAFASAATPERAS